MSLCSRRGYKLVVSHRFAIRRQRSCEDFENPSQFTATFANIRTPFETVSLFRNSFTSFTLFFKLEERKKFLKKFHAIANESVILLYN